MGGPSVTPQAEARDVIRRHNALELRRDEACRVLAQGRWLVLGVPFERARSAFDDAGMRDLRGVCPGVNPLPIALLVGERRAVEACVYLSSANDVVMTAVDDLDAYRLNLRDEAVQR